MHASQDGAIDEEISEMNVIPFIDICLVLLIIVLVTASFSVSLIGFNLPQGSKTEFVEADSAATVDVGPDGRCTVGGKTVHVSDLPQALEALRGGGGGLPPLIVRAKRDVKARHVVAAVDRIRSAGPVTLTFLLSGQ